MNPMIFVRDVVASSVWYQELLGAKSGHGGDEYELIVDDDDNWLLQLHHLEGEEHGDMDLDADIPRGAGVLLYIEVDDVRSVRAKAGEMGADVRSEPTYIELAYHTEFIVRDPDGYRLALYTRGRH